MGWRDIADKAFEKLDQWNEKDQQRLLAKLTPAERERYELWEQRTRTFNEALAADPSADPLEQLGDGRLTAEVMQGPAGEALAGIKKFPKVKDPIEDPAAWEEQMLAERGERDQVREPYLAPDRSPVKITRIATGGRSQVEEVADYLGSSGLAGRPDLVFGVYRVPDLISPGRLFGEKNGVVEWDIIHAAKSELAPVEPPATEVVAASEVFVRRAPGEPAPLDEQVGIDLLKRAGFGPGETCGVARILSTGKTGGDDTGDHSRIFMRASGFCAFAGSTVDQSRLDAARSGAPHGLPHGPPQGTVIDVLHWEQVARAVHPVRQQRAPLPSPFPYLPLTPQELIRSYLEIVGLDPADCWSTQVTHGRYFDLMGRTSMKWGVGRTGGGPDLPCADGKLRKRMAGGHHIVIAYQDSEKYRAGRERFDAWMRSELQAELRRTLGIMEPVPKPDGALVRSIDRAADIYEFFTMNPTSEHIKNHPRYCWPPTG
ncbi:MAG: hypothetical protein KDB52_10035 [Solirubrobacterales bacterium]|nr:hypothetical protein [Solirubrobacterales bacterium]